MKAQIKFYLRGALATIILASVSLNLQAGEKLSLGNAYSTNGSVPKNSKAISEKEIRALLESGDVFLQYPSKTKSGKEDIEQSNKENADYVRKMMNYYPSLKRFKHLLTPPKTEPLDGEGAFPVEITYRNGEKSIVALLGTTEIIRMLASSVRTMHSRAKQAEIYRSRWDSLPKGFFEKYKSKIVSPDIVSRESLAIVGKRNLELSTLLLEYIQGLRDSGVLPPKTRPLDCAGEIGSGDGTDRAIPPRGSDNPYDVDQPGAHHRDSLFARANFPLKWMTTCVKNQGQRGLCAVFAGLGALETSIAYRESRWVNLSEQYAWAFNRLNQSLSLSPGTPNIELLGELQTLIPYESGWDYNPSYYWCRVTGDCPDNNGLDDVCVGYAAEHCSESNHQGTLVNNCRGNDCFAGVNIAPAGRKEHKIDSVLNLWTEDDTALFNMAVSWTMVPTAAAGMTMDLLGNNTGFSWPVSCVNEAGFLIYDNACKQRIATSAAAGNSPGGGHQVQVVAAIPNNLLPEGVPQAASGGWYVIKNSWGSWWGDQGWVYVPSDWVADYGNGMWVIFGFQ